MSIDLPIPAIWLFQDLTLKFEVQGHSSRSYSGSNIILSFWLTDSFVPCQSALSFLKYVYFNIWKSNAMGEVSQGHTHTITQHPFNVFLLFRISLPNHSYDMTKSKMVPMNFIWSESALWFLSSGVRRYFDPVTIYWPRLRYLDLPNNSQWQSFISFYIYLIEYVIWLGSY